MMQCVLVFCVFLTLSGCEKADVLPTGCWQQQKKDGETVHYLCFTDMNTLEVYRKYPDEDCLVVLLAEGSAMSFRKTAPNQLQFEVMGVISTMNFVIDGKTLKFKFDDRTRAAFGHDDFLNDDYTWVGESLDSCVMSMQEWIQRRET